ncbi:MAG: hypothetical protein IT342_10815 [Candidatus Melainabacteria bacterium]|nr:hypothetical protein [Candidatus Melainabacteria bacterium]
MVQTAAYESSDYTAGGSARTETFADRFSSEVSLSDMKQYYDNQRASQADATQTDPIYAAILGDMEIVDEGAASTIESNGKGDTYFKSGSGSQLSAADHLSRSGWQDSGDAGRYFRTSDSSGKVSHEELQMASNSGDVVAKDPRPGQNRDEVRRQAYERLQRQAGAGGNSDENREKATVIGKKLLDGKDISKEMNDLPPAQRQAVMRELKRQLTEMPGVTVDVKENPGKPGDPSTASKYTKFQTKDGTIIAIEEGAISGEPRQIQVNGTGLTYKITGAREVYNANGQSKPDGSSGYNPVMRLREWAVPFTHEEIERALERKRQSGEK